ncbi:hypothetical protein ElyMa_001596000 [Elysia marginata]|uniref:Uncharacterized protein n=1 Tax=Elysia marginata TaxID=1093978 RepID=A0AAV4JJD0_9GAST|nr:hypothetical protein ElyMa_001596000 [Elysia marginata]
MSPAASATKDTRLSTPGPWSRETERSSTGCGSRLGKVIPKNIRKSHQPLGDWGPWAFSGDAALATCC